MLSQNEWRCRDARNFGIEKSFGKGYEYIAFADPDDVLELAYLEKLVNSIGDFDLAVCGYKAVTYDHDSIVSSRVFNSAP